jgi:glycosyltransferase involved in cell wall biosynthesis
MTLGAFTYVYNMIDYDYPFEESVKSIIDVVDQFVICECNSTDNTADLVEKLRLEYPNKIKVIHRNWVLHFTEISSVANFAMSHLNTDYAFQLQADEVVHHDSLDELKDIVNILSLNNLTAAKVHYTHFMANYETTFPFCYDSLVRIVKMNSPWRVIGDGVQFAYPDGQIHDEKVFDSNIQIFHYGKVKDPVKGWKKEWDFQQLYVDIGFPDPKMLEMKNKIGAKCDYIYLFREHVLNKTINKFTGTHPNVMENRIKQFKSGGFEQFVSEMEKNLSIME